MCAAYLLAMAAMWLSLGTAMGNDWAVQLVWSQDLKLFYADNNPALYDWLIWLLRNLVGPGRHVFVILTYALLGAIFVLYTLIARDVLRTPLLVAMAPWSLFLIGGFNIFNFTLSHSLLLILFYLAAVAVLFAIFRRPRASHFLLLGIVTGLGMLSKYSFGLVVLCLFAAACQQPPLREKLVRRQLVLSILPFAAIGGSVVIAHYATGDDMLSLFYRTTGRAGLSWAAQVGTGFAAAGLGLAVFCAAPAVMLLIGLGPLPGPDRGAPEAPAAKTAELIRFMRDVMLVGLLVLAVGILFFGLSKFRVWYLNPLLLLLPLYCLTVLERRVRDRRRRIAAVVFLTVVVAAYAAVRVIGFTPACSGPCRDTYPFDRLAERMRAEGFRNGTILSGDAWDSGNLLSYFPRARAGTVLDLSRPGPRKARPIGQCLVVWRDGDAYLGKRPRAALRKYLGQAGLADSLAGTRIRSARIDWRGPRIDLLQPFGGAAKRTTTWHYLLIERGNERCG